MLASDIDNDGDKDLLIPWNAEIGSHNGSLQILVNHGDRVFADETVARVGPPPQAGMTGTMITVFHAVNINNDGCPDLLFPDDLHPDDDFYPMEGGRIWLNDCNGYFTPVVEPGLSKLGGFYVPLDFDGDGDTDLLSTISKHLFYAGTEGCEAGEGDGSDHIDFAVLLNTSPTGDEPVIGVVSDRVILSGGTTTAMLYAEEVTTTNTLTKVYAEIIRPTRPGESVIVLPVNLSDAGNGRYEALYNQFGPTAGTYQISFLAEDDEGLISDPVETHVIQEEGPDRFEPDNAATDPPAIVVDGAAAQFHTIHEAADTDWVLFYAESEQTYEVKAGEVGANADIVIEIFETDGVTPVTDGAGDPFEADDGGAGQSELLLFTPTTDGIYFVKVSDRDSNTGGAGTGYDLRVDRPGTDEEADPFGGSDIAGFPGWKASPWYSNYNASEWPWIFHDEHGWQFVWDGSSDETVFLFDLGLNEWLFSNDNTYRSMFLFGDNPGWIFAFADNTPNRRFFSRLEDGSLFSVPADLAGD